jgi:glycosyltransferase involved in cell wall biosynthesis
MPSNYEGLGLVIMEAQANGCVPIAAHLRGVTDSVIAHGVDGLLVEPTDIAAYADAVERLMDAEEWRRCRRSGIDRAQQQYSVEQMARRYEALFESLVRGGIAA